MRNYRISVLFCIGATLACGAGYAYAGNSTFSSDLRFGESGPEVEALQVFLNDHGFPLAASGPGSPGNENEYFGALTRSALIRFQSTNHLPATGYFGALTRALIERTLDQALAGDMQASSTAASSSDSQTPSWIEFFNSHAPAPGWIPGFGGGGAPSSTQNQTPPDTIPPTVSLTSPSNGSTLAGAIALAASSSDNVGVASLFFAVDGVATGTRITVAPYTYTWNSANVNDGSHTIVAVASDAAGNVATSSSVTITTENAPIQFGLFSENATMDDTGEVVSWSTTEATNATIDYGTVSGGPYPYSVSSATLSTNHSMRLPNLSGGYYYFKVVSTNAASTTAT